ncbi:glutaredoxin family protein [Neisseria leonii]|uniref:Glutaredoxin family protein n=1 Tax=Neisseria leonii TaxID=2995413 RepID=A0A9X4E2B8_9NEIS|nr:glutaredoxin family protein [Neisseria sp. 51.81]MDD9328295.1 glutaredoxin family protein [Neisseria sp. 51.81]
MKLTLLFREYCSLCHRMRDRLHVFQTAYGFDLDIIDIDDFPDLEQQYNEKVPVLLHGAHEICHWHLDEAALLAYLGQAGGTAGRGT